MFHIDWKDLRIKISKDLKRANYEKVSEAIKKSTIAYREEEGYDYDHHSGQAIDYWHGYILYITFYDPILPIDDDLEKLIYNKIQNATKINIINIEYCESLGPSIEFDVAISYAREDKNIALEIAEKLKKQGIKVFYDDFFKAEIWGRALDEYFNEVYGRKSKFIIILVSKNYPKKDWTNFEFKIARSESLNRPGEFILPIRLDDTNLFGLKDTIGYIRYSNSDEIVNLIKKKIKQF